MTRHAKCSKLARFSPTMKNISRQILAAACAAVINLALPATSHAVNLMLNFSLGDPATNTPNNARTIAGFDNVTAPFVGTAVNAAISNIDGTGYNFTINNVSSYDTGVNAEPLTTSGFYNFGNDTNDHTFTLSGLPAGALVTLYAVSAWDGNGRGGTLVFGGSTTQAQVIGDPGTAPTLANFTQIDALPAVVGLNGILTGTLNGAGGVGSGTEGQIGGFVFVVTVPEPSTVAISVLGVMGLGVWTLRRRRLTA